MLPSPAELDASRRKQLKPFERAALFYWWNAAAETNERINRVITDPTHPLPADLENLQWDYTWGVPDENKTPPYFAFEGLRVWWVEGPRVDPKTDIKWNLQEWEAWLGRSLARLEEYERSRLRKMMLGSNTLVEEQARK